jgi:hypothetical protein
VASVATGFSSGQYPLANRLEETRFAVAEGADEIDMVISRGQFLAGEHAVVFDEIAAIKEACGPAHLKVILETGELGTLDNVRRASDIAMHAGADFINGKFVAPVNDNYFPTINPATEKKLADIADGSAEDIDAAVKSARRAYDKTWSKLPPKERGKYLYRIARILQERAREFAVIESMDGGKPIRESRDIDIPLAAAHFFYYAGWADKLEYAFPGRRAQPLGVAGQIIPWNFPLLMAAWKIAPALACGNTVVLKPAETTPRTALRLAQVIADAGLPPGVVNIVTGAGDAGAALVDHPDVDKIAFTGSTEVGKAVLRALAPTKQKYTLELGGKAANFIFDDATLDQAVEGIINGIFFNQGHVCCAGSRLLVQESVYPTVLRKLQDRMPWRRGWSGHGSQGRSGRRLDRNRSRSLGKRKRLDRLYHGNQRAEAPENARGRGPRSCRRSQKSCFGQRQRSLVYAVSLWRTRPAEDSRVLDVVLSANPKEFLAQRR